MLDREVVVRELEEKVMGLEAEVERLRVGSVGSRVGRGEGELPEGGKSWWKVW